MLTTQGLTRPGLPFLVLERRVFDAVFLFYKMPRVRSNAEKEKVSILPFFLGEKMMRVSYRSAGAHNEAAMN